MDIRQAIQSTKWHRLRDAEGAAGPVAELLLDLLDAGSRDEAAECVDALTDRVGHRGSAVTEATAPVTQVLSSMIADPGFRWKADVLCTLDIFSRSIGAWERVSIFGRRSKVEKQAEAALVAALPAARGLLNEEDPEVRAMSADFLASTTPDADAVVAELMTLFAAEPNPATRATIAEAVARNLARMTNPAAIAKEIGRAHV